MRKHSQSVQIFKKQGTNPSIDDTARPSIQKSSNNINQVSIPPSQQETIKISLHKDINSVNNSEHNLHKNSQIAISEINLSKRIDKIEEKLNSINAKVNSSKGYMDSRIKSQNDISGIDESKIIKNRSFLSYNI
jgi:hypothetical protein